MTNPPIRHNLSDDSRFPTLIEDLPIISELIAIIFFPVQIAKLQAQYLKCGQSFCQQIQLAAARHSVVTMTMEDADVILYNRRLTGKDQVYALGLVEIRITND